MKTENRQHREIIKAAALRMAMEMRHKEQLQQSPHGFTCPKPSKCKDYGKEYPQETGDLKLWQKCALAAAVVIVLGMCAMLRGYAG